MSLKDFMQGVAGSSSTQLYVDDVFSTYLYTGNNSGGPTPIQTITNGIDLSTNGGMVWLKGRAGWSAGGVDNNIYDTDRGVRKYIISNSAAAQSTASTGAGLTSFNSNGFTLGTTWNTENFNGYTYVSWTFRKAAKFFDVVTYTGNGTSQNISHSLGIVPGMIIVKSLTNGTSSWRVWHRSFANTDMMMLNSTAAKDTGGATAWNSTLPTSSQFTVGSFNQTNASGEQFVAYLFAHDTTSTGIIQCGSYTGNGSTTGPTVSLGWEPQWILFKNTGASGGNWVMVDNMRGIAASTNTNNIGTQYLYTESAAAEYASTSSVGVASITSTGFQLNGATVINYNTESHIYIAIRFPNKPPTSASQVFGITKYTGNNSTTTGQPVTMPFAIDMAINRYNISATGDWDINSRIQGLSSTNTNTTRYLNPHLSSNSEGTGGYLYNVFNNSAKIYGFSSSTTQENYLFKRAPGFFDIVGYVGDGSTNRAITHSLSVSPEMVIVRARTLNNENWYVYHKGLNAGVNPQNYGIYINTTNAQSVSQYFWNNTAPTSTQFTISSGPNNNTGNYISYLFATLAGISKVGYYTGNGSSQNIECGFAAGAKFILIKRTDVSGYWYVWDTARGIVSSNDGHLMLNDTSAEVTSDDTIDPYLPGFTVNQVSGIDVNVTSATYIFLAIA